MHTWYLQERCDVVYGGVEGDLRKKFQLVRKIKMQALHGHDAVFLNSNSCCPGKPLGKPAHELSQRKVKELRGNNIFASIKPEPRRCYKPNSCNDIFASIKPDPRRCYKPSSRASSRQSSGGKSSRASSKGSEFPSLKHMWVPHSSECRQWTWDPNTWRLVKYKAQTSS